MVPAMLIDLLPSILKYLNYDPLDEMNHGE